jgi:MFS family permease
MDATNNYRGKGTGLFGLLTGSVFILNAIIFFFQALTKNLFPPLLLPLREAFLIDNAQAGLLITLVFFGYALARFPSGIMADRIGCTKTVLIGSTAMAFSFLGVALSPGYPVMALMTFILGISSGIYVTAGYTLAVIIGSRERAATATAAFESFGIIASIASPALVTVFVLFLNWQLLFIVSGLLLAVATFVFYRFRGRSAGFEIDNKSLNSNSLEQAAESAQSKSSVFTIKSFLVDIQSSTIIFRDPLIRRFITWSTLVGGLGALSWTGINSFIPAFLVDVRGYSYEIANQMFIIVAVAGLLAKIVTGSLADRFGNNVILFFNLVLSIFLFIALTVATGHLQILLILALLGAACLNTNTLINSYVLRNMPPGSQGAGFGLFSTAYTVIYSAGPYLTGFLSELFGLSRAIQVSTVGAIFAAALILTANKFVPKQMVSRMADPHK